MAIFNKPLSAVLKGGKSHAQSQSQSHAVSVSPAVSPEQEPWEREGISRATWFRRQQKP